MSVVLEIAIGYQGGHWEAIFVDSDRDVDAEHQFSEGELYELLPLPYSERQDISFLHVIYFAEPEEDQHNPEESNEDVEN